MSKIGPVGEDYLRRVAASIEIVTCKQHCPVI